jgi:tetratricopeptide (TPR) repeat protein
MADHRERGLLLFQQSRFDLAEKELRQALLDEPNDAVAHGLLAMCLSERKEFAAATEEARSAVGAEPDNPFTHFAMAHVLYDRDRLDEAARAVGEAIRLDHESAPYFSLLAAIRCDQKQWQEGLDAAGKGLEIDPEHVGCANLRGMALINLGRKAEAGSAIEGVLAQDPNNAFAHSTKGWALLEGGDRLKAVEHFKEALRIDPELRPARAGIVEALKAKNVVYAVLLRYFLWMSRLGTGAQWGLIIGGIIAVRVLRRLARNEPALAPWIWPVLILYFTFVVLTWIADPLFNLLLRLDPLGRHALSREQVTAANWVGGTLLAAAGAAVAALVLGKPEALVSAAGLGLLAIPVAGTFQCEAGWPRTAMALLTAILGLLCLASLAAYIASPSGNPGAATTARGLAGVGITGILLSTWVALALSAARPKK